MKRPALRLVAFMAAMFGAMGVHIPFWPVWLRAHGASPTEIGWLLATTIFARALTPWIAQRIDERGRRRRTAIVLSVVSAAVIAGFAATDGIWAWLLLSAAFGACGGVLLLLSDTIAVLVAGSGYGRIRLWGSAAFLGTAVVSGRILDTASVEFVWWLVLGGLLLTVLAATALPEPDVAPAVPTDGRRPLRALLGMRPFLLLAAGCGIVQGTHAGMFGFGSIHWQRAGIDETTIGALWATGVLAEIGLFLIGRGLVARIGPVGLAVCGGLGAMLRWAVFASTTTVPILFVAQLLHAATFAATHLGVVTYIGQRLPKQLAVTAQSLYWAVGTGLAMGSATLAAGPLYESFGGGLFWVMSGLAAVGTALVLAVRQR